MLQRQLGHLVLKRIVESEYADFDPLAFFPETTPEAWAPHKGWLQPRAMDPVSGNLIFPMQSYLVRTRHHTILVDTCVGDHKKRQRPSWNMTTHFPSPSMGHIVPHGDAFRFQYEPAEGEGK